MSYNIDQELLYRYFSGQTTPLENARIEQWLGLKENEEIFFYHLEQWERRNPQYVPDKNLGFQRFELRLEPEHQYKNYTLNDLVKLPSIRFNKNWWLIAASLAILILTAFMAGEQLLYKQYITRYGETMTLVLDDGSRVVLNANSSLKVPRWMNFASQREVWMTGEAFFNIESTSDHSKFLVHTNNLNVEVLGTRFNVTDRRNATKVVLQEGKVKVTANHRKGEMALLEETGDYAEVQVHTPQIITRTVDESLYTTWQEKRLKFKETPLPQVLQTIEDYYGIEILTEDTTLYDRKFSGTLPNNDLDIILQALSNIYGSGFLKAN